jgi:phenylacetate-CoA ligase
MPQLPSSVDGTGHIDMWMNIVDEDTVILELQNVDKNGVGDLLVTNLYSYDFPLIRYPLGDKVKFSDKKCSCGRNTKIIEKIIGRDIDYFELPDGRKIAYTENSIQIANMCPNLISYQLVYNKTKSSITFRYKLNKNNPSFDKEVLEKYFMTNYSLPLLFEEVDHIESSKSGKHALFKTVEK